MSPWVIIGIAVAVIVVGVVTAKIEDKQLDRPQDNGRAFVTCSECGGEGYTYHGVCLICNGLGTVSRVPHQTPEEDKTDRP